MGKINNLKRKIKRLHRVSNVIACWILFSAVSFLMIAIVSERTALLMVISAFIALAALFFVDYLAGIAVHDLKTAKKMRERKILRDKEWMNSFADITEEF